MGRKKLTLKRKWIQLASALIYNANLQGFIKGEIFQGRGKGMCVPGLNCYSCPGAIAACPLGSLQNALSSVTYRWPMYIVGVLLLFGLLLGRIICGFLCPFGWLQELLYKIPLPKIKKNRFTRLLSYGKYVVLAVFVAAIPLYQGIRNGMPVPAFCKYICPAGTLEGGIPLVSRNSALQELTGALFSWKVFVMAVILISACVLYRSFCRFLCPLGAIYSLFAKVSILGIQVEKDSCNHCNACVRACKMDIKMPGDRECIQCGECMEACSRQAIRWKTVRGKHINKPGGM